MDWARILAFITGMVDQELLARNEYLAAENRILKAQLKGRLKLSGLAVQASSAHYQSEATEVAHTSGDSTALSARMDPEDLREVISTYQKCAAETVGCRTIAALVTSGAAGFIFAALCSAIYGYSGRCGGS